MVNKRKRTDRRKPCVVRWHEHDATMPEFGACYAHTKDFRSKTIGATLHMWCDSFLEATILADELNTKTE